MKDKLLDAWYFILDMNLPNKLTLMRIVLVPIFLIFALIDAQFCHFIALVIFIAASLTDLFDGKIARRRKLVTNFGKFMDPLADKVLTTSAYLVIFHFHNAEFVPGWVWMLTLILAREFIVAGIRLVASEQGIVIAASFYGKLKTVVQMIALIFGLVIMTVNPSSATPVVLVNVFLWLSTLLCVLSGIDYLKKASGFLKAQI